MSELKPCPFCGSKAEVYGECEMVKIRCSSYMCQASVNGWHDEVEDAIDAWNKRTKLACHKTRLLSEMRNKMLASKVDGYVGEYNAVLNAVNVIKSFIDKHGAESGSSYWKSNIDDEILVTDWGYVEEGLELLKGYCLKLMKGADNE